MGLITGLGLIAALFGPPGKAGALSAVELNGERTEVHWSDGDSFKFKTGRFKGVGTRLMGYNSLESYGPVHAWGEFTGEELYQLAKNARFEASSQVWKCTTNPDNRDHYGRLLVLCPDLIVHMVSVGAGHLMAVDEEPLPKAVEAQKAAIAAKKGMWAKGVPERIITSLHSADEEPGKQPYNRLADPLTGKSEQVFHNDTYAECQTVCMNGACMLYVPFKKRYGRNRSACLSWGKGARVPGAAAVAPPSGAVEPAEPE
ncbi:MAG: nuclease [Myxococcales bacterium]|nr:nuclease [Myxococcales bacterium]MCB9548422.1 nuclease [Myxococcales bacterium]